MLNPLSPEAFIASARSIPQVAAKGEDEVMRCARICFEQARDMPALDTLDGPWLEDLQKAINAANEGWLSRSEMAEALAKAAEQIRWVPSF